MSLVFFGQILVEFFYTNFAQSWYSYTLSNTSLCKFPLPTLKQVWEIYKGHRKVGESVEYDTSYLLLHHSSLFGHHPRSNTRALMSPKFLPTSMAASMLPTLTAAILPRLATTIRSLAFCRCRGERG
jgi:hypothetical protein